MKLKSIATLAAAAFLAPALTSAVRAADILVPASPWNHLLRLDDGNNQIDPALVDPDFYETWFLPTGNPGYDGPLFTNAAGPFAYGTVDYFTNNGIVPTVLGTVPNTNTRGTVYFKTEIDLGPNALTNVQLEILSDDGFLLFLDGNMVTPYAMNNMDVISTQWNAPAHSFEDINLINMESQTFLFGAGTAVLLADLGPGVHTLALTLHQANGTSSDIGLSFRLSGDLVPIPEPSAAAALLALGTLLLRRRR